MNTKTQALNILAIFYRYSPDHDYFHSIQQFFSAPDWQEHWPACNGLDALKEIELSKLSNQEWLASFGIEFPLAVPPWGSVFLDHEGVLHGESTQAVENDLKRLQLTIETGVKEPIDHIGLLLMVMATLASQDRTQEMVTFYQRHLETWVFDYLEKLQQTVEQPQIEAMLLLTRATLESISPSYLKAQLC